MRIIFVLLFLSFFLTNLCASQNSYYEKVSKFLTYSNASEDEEKLWLKYLKSFKSYKIQTIDSYFKEASEEFGVPESLLKVIGYLENNWVQIGPSVDYGWGIMHLVENEYCDTLGQASKLLNIDRQTLKDNPRQNIRGAAAVISAYAKEMKLNPKKLEDWFPAISKFSGLYSKELRNQQAFRYYSILKNGVSELNIFDKKIKIQAIKSLNIQKFKPANNKFGTTDYPKAKSQITKYNFTRGRSHKVDTWVVHHIGVGTYAGAISWFQNPKAKASAHFCIRHTDGEITQVVRTDDTSWNCGAKNGKYNNQRSIGIEHESTLTHPEWWQSEIMLKESGKIASYFCDKYGINKKREFPGIMGHKEMPGCNTFCPGECPWDKLMTYITSGSDTDDSDFIKAYIICPNDTANVRKGPGMSYSVITALVDGTKVSIIKQSGNWLNIATSEGVNGWVYKSLLIEESSCKKAIAKSLLTLKKEPSSSSFSITTISSGTSMIILGTTESWSRVRLNDGTVGYVETYLLDIK